MKYNGTEYQLFIYSDMTHDSVGRDL